MSDVAVIICAHKTPPGYLAEAITSVRLQDGVEWHLLVWLDGYDPGLFAEACTAAGDDERCCVVEEPHNGLGEALDGAWQLAEEVWMPDAVALLDADDRLLPGALANTLLALESADAGLAYTNYTTIDEAGKRIDNKKHGIQWEKADPIDGQAAFHMLMFSSKALREIGGFDVELPLCPQFDATVKVQMGSPVVFHNEVLYEYRIHREQVTKRRSVEQAECMKKIRQRARGAS